MSLFERIKNKRYDLQERKKNPPPQGDGSGSKPVTTDTSGNPLETIFGDNKNKKKKEFVNQNERPKGETPPKNETPLTKHQKERLKIERSRKKYNLKPDSRGIYKPTKSSVLGSIETNIKRSSTPPKVSAKKDASSLKKFNQQMRRSQKYSGNENSKRVQKIVNRIAKNQKIDKSKAGLVQRQKELAYGKNPYKKVFGSVNYNMQKKYDDQMLKIGGKDSKLMTQKQLNKLQTKIANQPKPKTMTFLSPAGSGKPVPFKPKKVIVKPEPLRTFKTMTDTELEKLTTPKGFTKTKTGSFTRKTGFGNKFTKGIVKGLKKIGPRGKAAAALLALTGVGVAAYNKGKQNDKKRNTPIIVPPPSKSSTIRNFGISLGGS